MEPTTADDWESHWDDFAGAAAENPAQRMRHRLALRLLCENAPPSVRLFDIGSGQGDFAAKAAAALPGVKILGVELSESGAALCREKVPGGTFVAADLLNPPAPLDEYKGWATHALCSEVLEHVDDPVKFLVAARQYLSPGALLVVTVPGGPMSAFDRHIGHRTHFTRESLGAALRAAGYIPERGLRTGFPFFNLYRLTVIARGSKLADDVAAGASGGSNRLARLAMRVFDALFRLNLPDVPCGWQIVGVARNP